MTKDIRKNFKIDAEVLEKIQYIAQVTGWSQQQVLKVLIEPYFEVASTFKKCTFENWSSIKDRSVLAQFYGRIEDQTLILGEVNLGSEKTNLMLGEKLADATTDQLVRNTSKPKSKGDKNVK